MSASQFSSLRASLQGIPTPTPVAMGPNTPPASAAVPPDLTNLTTPTAPPTDLPLEPLSPTPLPEPLPIPSLPVEPAPVVEPTPPIEPSFPTTDVTPPSLATEDPANPVAPSSEKSPLEVLEEILAGADAEKSKEEEEKKKKEAEEAEFAAQLKAKEEAFAVEAAAKMAQTQADVQAAAVRRDQVEQDLIHQGKVQVKQDTGNDPFKIMQLVHEQGD